MMIFKIFECMLGRIYDVVNQYVDINNKGAIEKKTMLIITMNIILPAVILLYFKLQALQSISPDFFSHRYFISVLWLKPLSIYY